MATFGQTQTSKTFLFLFGSWTGATCDQRWMIVSMILNKMKWNEVKYAVDQILVLPLRCNGLFAPNTFCLVQFISSYAWQQDNFVAQVTMTAKSVLLRRLQVRSWTRGCCLSCQWSPLPGFSGFVPQSKNMHMRWIGKPWSVRYCECLPVFNPIFAQRLLGIDSRIPQDPEKGKNNWKNMKIWLGPWFYEGDKGFGIVPQARKAHV